MQIEVNLKGVGTTMTMSRQEGYRRGDAVHMWNRGVYVFVTDSDISVSYFTGLITKILRRAHHKQFQTFFSSYGLEGKSLEHFKEVLDKKGLKDYNS